MAGHSKWANIRFKKAAQDAKRGKVFTKLIREITVAARMGGADQEANPRLRDAVNKALKSNMKRDTIDNAIKRGSGNLEGSNYDEIRYEGYAPGGVAVMVDCLTDNRNRTVAEVRHLLTKHGGNLGTEGSVSYLFNHLGILQYPSSVDEEKLLDKATEAGVEDMSNDDDGSFQLEVAAMDFERVKQSLEAEGFEAEYSEATMVPTTEIEVNGDTAETILKLIDALEDLDDVQNVYTNLKLSEEHNAS